MGDKRNYAALDWVIGEIGDTLKDARQSLEAFVEDPRDTARIRFCLTHIHQVHGSLQMVEFHGASLFAEEMESLAEALMNGDVTNEKEAQEALMRSLLQLPLYLEQVKNQHDDHPGVVLPLLNDLRAVRKQSYLSETNLFNPDLSTLGQVRGERPALLQDRAKLKEIFKKLRDMYQYAAASVLRGVKVDQNLGYIEKVLTRLEAVTRGTLCHPTWQAGAALAEALVRDDVELSIAVRGLLRYLARELRIIEEHCPAALEAPARESLLRNLLYYVARSEDGGPRVAQVKRQYGLDKALLGGTTSRAQMNRGLISPPEPDAIRSVVLALQDELNTCKHLLDSALSGQGSMSDVEQMMPYVKRIADTLAVLGIGEMRKQMMAQYDALAKISAAGTYDDIQLIDIAGALANIENRLEAIAKGAGKNIDYANVDERAVEIDSAKEAVIAECRSGLEKVKEAIVEFMSTQWDPSNLPAALETLHYIQGGLNMVPLERSAKILSTCGLYIQEQLIARETSPGQDIQTLALAIGSVDYYLERLAAGHGDDLESYLDLAEDSLAQLGYPSSSRARVEAANDLVVDETELAYAATALAEHVVSTADQANVEDRENTVDAEQEITVDGGLGHQAEGFLDQQAEGSLDQQAEGSLDQTSEGFLDQEAEGFLDQTAEGSLDQTAEGSLDQTAKSADWSALDMDSSMASASPRDDIDSLQEESFVAAEDEDAFSLSSEASTPSTVAQVGSEEEEESHIDEEIIEIFVEEAAEVQETLAEYFPAWCNNRSDEEALMTVRRAFHTLKGSGRMVEALDVGELAWSIENMLNRILDRTITPDETHIRLIEAVLDLVPSLISAFEHRQPNPAPEKHAQYIEWANSLSKGVVPPELQGAGSYQDFKPSAAAAEADDLLEDDDSEENEDQVLWEIFASEANTHLQVIDEFVNEMEQDAPLYSPPSDSLQRALHTLKGSAHMAAVTPIAALISPLESFVKELRGYQVKVDPDILQLVKDAADYTREGLEYIYKKETVTLPKLEQFVARVQELLDRHITPLIHMEEQEGVKAVDPRLLAIIMAEEMGLLLDADVVLAGWRADSSNATSDMPELVAELQALAEAASHANLAVMNNLALELVNIYQLAMANRLPLDDEFYTTLTLAHENLLDMVDQVAAGQDVKPTREAVALRLLELADSAAIATAENNELLAGLAGHDATQADSDQLDFAAFAEANEIESSVEVDSDLLDLTQYGGGENTTLADDERLTASEDAGDDESSELTLEFGAVADASDEEYAGFAFEETSSSFSADDFIVDDSTADSPDTAINGNTLSAGDEDQLLAADLQLPEEPVDLLAGEQDEVELTGFDFVEATTHFDTDEDELTDTSLDLGSNELSFDVDDGDEDTVTLLSEADGQESLTTDSLDLDSDELSFDIDDGDDAITLVSAADGQESLTTDSLDLDSDELSFEVDDDDAAITLVSAADGEESFTADDFDLDSDELSFGAGVDGVVDDHSKDDLLTSLTEEPIDLLAGEQEDDLEGFDFVAATTHFDSDESEPDGIDLAGGELSFTLDGEREEDALAEATIDLLAGEQDEDELVDFDFEEATTVVERDELVADGHESELDDEFGEAPLEPELSENASNKLSVEPRAVVEAPTTFMDVSTLSNADMAFIAEEDFDPDILEIFLEEAGELLEELDEAIHAWESDWNNAEPLEVMKRALHTLKGGARLSGLMNLGELTHEYESFLISRNNPSNQANFFQVVIAYQDRVISGVRGVQAKMDGEEIQEEAHSLVSTHTDAGTDTNVVEDEPVDLEESAECLSDMDLMDEPEEAPLEAAAPVFERDATAQIVPFRAKTETMPSVAEDGEFLTPKQKVAPVSQQMQKRQGPQEMIKVSADLLEELVNLAGETSISRGRLEQQISDLSSAVDEVDGTLRRLNEQLRRLDLETEAQVLFRQEQMAAHEGFDPLEMDRYSQLQQLTRSLMESSSDLVDLKTTLADKIKDTETLLLQQSRINSALQEGLMRSRMVPFSRLVPRLRRIVRQVSGELGKHVNFELDNVEGEMDRSVLERMVAPLEHMLRNAVDHGVEMPEVRVAAGKPETGRILLSLAREGGDILLRLADDGQGINLERVRQKAIERGLMTAEAGLSDHDVMQFILQAGFSTAESVTQISGRGVGMDVVAAEIKQLGGSIVIDSKTGVGSQFTVRLPFTVSVNRALMVQLGTDTYAIPLNTIEGIVRVSPFELEHYYSHPDARFEYAGENYQVRHLGSILNDEMQPKLEGQVLPLPVILVRSAQNTMALQVDALMGSREIVVKSLGPQFAAVQGLSGATVMGDGSVVIILDPHALVRREMALIAAPAQSALKPREIAPREDVLKTIMVVDDSVTVRKVTTRFLEREGFNVITAKDGVDALQVLQEEIPDLMLLDIEMPRMDGFEVAKNIRSTSRLKHLPIIMITSRTGDKHRQHALSIGVNEYMGKPYQEELLLKTMESLLKIPSTRA